MARRPDLFQLCPGKKNVQPSQPRQLGYSQGAMEKLEGCGTTLELGELGGGAVMSQEQGVLYYFGTGRTWHLPCSMSETKRRLVDEGLVSVLACGDLSLSSGRFVRRGLGAFLTTF